MYKCDIILIGFMRDALRGVNSFDVSGVLELTQ